MDKPETNNKPVLNIGKSKTGIIIIPIGGH